MRLARSYWNGIALALTYVSVLAFVLWALMRQNAGLTEDAYIFLRYARNLADGYGFVYNPGGERVEGATSLPYLFCVAALLKLGVEVELAPQLAGGFFTVLSVVAVVAIGLRQGATHLVAGAAGAVVGACALPWLARSGYDVPIPFFFSVLSAGAALELLSRGPGATQTTKAQRTQSNTKDLVREETGQAFWFFALSTVCLGLSRPDAYFLVVPAVVLVAAKHRHNRAMWRALAAGLAVTLVWHSIRRFHFGYWLPNTFYVKAGHQDFYMEAFSWYTPRFLKAYSLVLLLGTAAAVALWVGKRGTLLYLFIPAVFLASWILTDQEMNIEERFQLPALAWMLMAVVFGASKVRRLPSNVGSATLALIAVLLLWQVDLRLSRQDKPYDITDQLTVFRRIAKSLHKYKDQGVGLATTEAGVMPFYTNWRSLDTHGLNDTTVAHVGLEDSYIDGFRPLVIELHDVQVHYPGWAEMLGQMKRYADMRGFTEVWYWAKNDGKDVYRFYVDLEHPLGPAVRRDIIEAARGNGTVLPLKPGADAKIRRD